VPRSSKYSHSFRFFDQNFVCIPYLVCAFCMPHPSHPPWFVKLLIMKFFSSIENNRWMIIPCSLDSFCVTLYKFELYVWCFGVDFQFPSSWHSIYKMKVSSTKYIWITRRLVSHLTPVPLNGSCWCWNLEFPVSNIFLKAIFHFLWEMEVVVLFKCVLPYWNLFVLV